MKYFNITFAGPMASGKTVAMKQVKTFLEEQGYEVKTSLEHSLSVRWDDKKS